MQIPLKTALGNLANWPRFFVWRLTDWNGKKFETKRPWNGAHIFDAKVLCLANALMTYDDAVAALQAISAAQTTDKVVFSLGWYVMPDAGYWFLDIDGNTQGASAQRAWSVLGHQGVFFEFSSSGNGVHFIGRGQLPPHQCRNGDLPSGIELYSKERGICFGLSGMAVGSADVGAMPPPEWVIEDDKAPVLELVGGTRMPEWVGPEDDDELIKRMLARQDDRARFNPQLPSLQKLWAGDTTGYPGESEADRALATHLAWWTGCDADRIIRLMWRSGLVRDKWHEHRTYLAITTRTAIADHMRKPERTCYKQPLPKLTLALPVIVPAPVVEAPPTEPHRGVGAGCEIVSKAGNSDELKAAAGRIVAMGPWDAPDLETLAQRLQRKSKELGSSWPLALCRRMIDGTAPDSETFGAPEWLDEWAFIATQNKYCHIAGDFDAMGKEALHVALYHKSELPIKSNGDKEEAAKMLNMWGVQVVSDLGYNPRGELTFYEGGRKLLNKFHNSMPEPVVGGSAEAIEIYKQHLWNLCNHNQEHFNYLLRFMAHIVQFPGKPVRWATLLIGAHGTGKTAFTTPLALALGKRNVKIGSAKGVNNGGGFMDWVASEQCLGIISDFHVSGHEKYSNRDAIKPVISDDVVSITRKGKVDMTYNNYASYIMSTNQREPVPMEPTERRWFVLMTTWLDGLVTRSAEATEYFKRLEWATKHALTPGQWREWFMSIEVGELPATAPITAGFRAIVGNSVNEASQAIAECVEGFDVVTTNKITDALRGLDGAPSTRALTKAMNALGFDYYDAHRLKIEGGNKTGVYVRSAKINIATTTWEEIRAKAQDFIGVKNAHLFARIDPAI